MASRRAMIAGAELAETLNDGGAAEFYRKQAASIAMSLQQYWSAEKQSFIETLGQTNNKRKSGIDVAIVLAALHGETSDGYLSPANDMILSSATQILRSFQYLYKININAGDDIAPAIGRYPEDVYSGSNQGEAGPWFLATLAYAELSNRVRDLFNDAGKIQVSELNKSFLKMALDTIGKGGELPAAGTTVSRYDQAFQDIQKGLSHLSDNFFRRVLLHKGSAGELSEQFNRYSGYLQSAPNLTWSHAAFISAAMSR
jgi:glucoamylase